VYQVAAKSEVGAAALLAAQRKQQESVEQQFKPAPRTGWTC